MRFSRTLAASLVPFLFAAGGASAQCSNATPPMMPPVPGGYTHQAFATGTWNSPATWDDPESDSPPTVPGDGAIVLIPAGKTVTVHSQESSRLRYVMVKGTLRFWIHGSTRLLVDSLVVDHYNPATGDGYLVAGAPSNPVKAGNVAEIVFISWDGNNIDTSVDTDELGRGLVAMGKVDLYGLPKTHMMTMKADAPAGAATLTLDNNVPADWQLGDEIVLTGSYFRETSGEHSSQDETRTIAAINPDGNSPKTIALSAPLIYPHLRPHVDLRFHVANLTRNILLSSEAKATSKRGHVMLMDSGQIRYVAMENLGRTDKRVPLDDFTVTTFGVPYNFTDYNIAPKPAPLNRRGRYSLHFHLNYSMHPMNAAAPAPSTVYGSVVRGAIGWGFVSHSSHVNFHNNVAHDFYGAGFVTEFGDELGSYTNNIAIRGKGNGEYRPVKIVFNNLERPQPLGDFGFSGDGFWFQGPALRVRNNVAAGCDGAGMIFFTTGAPKPGARFQSSTGTCHDRYSSFPRSQAAVVYAGFPDVLSHQPRNWDYSTDALVIADLPILEMDGFDAYGNLVGFRLRFNNHNSVAWYAEPGFNFHHQIEGTIGAGQLMRQKVKNLRLWNNEQAFSMRYVANTDWQNVQAYNRLDHTLDPNSTTPSTTSSWVGGEIFHILLDSTFTDLTIDGYEVATRIEANGIDASNEIAFLGNRTYLNYALEKTMVPGTCAAPVVSSLLPATSSTTKTLTLTPNAAHHRYLVRYRAKLDQPWQYDDSTTNVLTLTGLLAGKTYTYQVVGECDAMVNGLSKHGVTSQYTDPTDFNN